MANFKKGNAIVKKSELERVRSGKVFVWYRDTKKEVLENNLPFIPYDYKGARRYLELSIHFQLKNAKMKPTEKIAFLIFSIPAVLTCPGATGLCIHNCYARRDERFPSVRASRLGNWILSLLPNFADILEKAILQTVYDRRGKVRKAFEGKKIIVRVHESGDFYNLEYMLKWFEVARRFPEIQFFAYTKSFTILEKCIDQKPSNFVMRASIWDDTPENDLYIIDKYNLPYYKALATLTGYGRKNTCDCEGGCGGCGCKCSNEKLKAIVTEIH